MPLSSSIAPPEQRLALLMEAPPGSEQALTTAGALLLDDDPCVREQAARTLIDAGTAEAAAHALPHIAAPHIAVRNLAGDVLHQIGAPAVGGLLAYLTHADKDVRKFAIDVLALLPAQDAADRLLPLLEDADANVRLAAVDALGTLGGPTHAPALRVVYASEPAARANAVYALGKFGCPEDLPLLRDALADDDPSVLLAAAEALAYIDDPSVWSLLERAITEVGPMAQPIVLGSIVQQAERRPEAAADTLQAVTPLLFGLLEDIDDEYVGLAVRGLRLARPDGYVQAVLPLSGRADALDVEIYTTLATRPHAVLQLEAALQAEAAAPGVLLPFLIGLVADGLVPAADAGTAAALLARHFRSFDAQTKQAALAVAARTGDDRYAALLQLGSDDPDPAIRVFAEDVIAALPSPR